jgi:hypothetical protein
MGPGPRSRPSNGICGRYEQFNFPSVGRQQVTESRHIVERPGVRLGLVGAAFYRQEQVMKLPWIVLVFAGTTLLTGCSGSTSSGGLDEAAKKAKDAIKAEAATLHKELEEHLKKLDKQYDEWKAKAATATGDAKVKMEAKLAELDKEKAKVKEQLAKLKDATPEMWKDAKEEAHKAVGGLKDAFEKAKEHFQ